MAGVVATPSCQLTRRTSVAPARPYTFPGYCTAQRLDHRCRQPSSDQSRYAVGFLLTYRYLAISASPKPATFE